jgi:hypothetical protein
MTKPWRPLKDTPLPESWLRPATGHWAWLDPSSAFLQHHLEDLLQSLLDRGVGTVGLASEPDALEVPGWDGMLRRCLQAGLRCLVGTALPSPLTSGQVALLARCEELWLPSEAAEGAARDVLEALREASRLAQIQPPRVRVSVAPDRPDRPRPAGTTRGCLDPWEGVVLGAEGRTHPCRLDPVSVGDHREQGLSLLLDGPALRRRREALLRGRLPEACLACGGAPWVPLQALRDQVAAHAAQKPRPDPPFTASEAQGLFRQWAAEQRRVLLYPAGNHALWLVHYAPDLLRTLVAFGDRDPRKQGLTLYGLPVWAPETIHPDRVDTVLVAVGEGEEAIRTSLRPLADEGIRLVSARRIAHAWRAAQGAFPGGPP